MQSSIINDIKITPNEVKTYLRGLNVDEIPTVDTQLELSQLVVLPKITKDEQNTIKSKLNNFRKRIYDGEDFKVLASLYSDDVLSANNSGELGFMSRGQLVPEFERAAFKLNSNEVSEVVESTFGFHIIQLNDIRESKPKKLSEIMPDIHNLIKKKSLLNLEKQIRKNQIIVINKFEDVAKKVNN